MADIISDNRNIYNLLIWGAGETSMTSPGPEHGPNHTGVISATARATYRQVKSRSL